MEGIYWFRISAVVILFVGSIWILLPSIFRESAEAQFASQSQNINTTTHQTSLLDDDLDVKSGDPTALAAALEKRLDAAGIGTDQVKGSPGEVDVKLKPGSTKADVERLAQKPGKVALFPVSAFGPVPAKGSIEASAPRAKGAVADALKSEIPADADYWSAVVQPIAGKTAPTDGAVALAIDSGKAEQAGGGKVTWAQGATFPADAPFLVVAVDGTPAGLAFRDGTVAQFDGQVDVVPVMVSGALPGVLAPASDKTQATQAGPAVAATESRVPDWLKKIMPTSLAIPLGLDLQGGIDLTLQVEVDEAVLGQATRDINGLKDAAGKEGLKLDSVRRSHGLPVIEVTSDAPLSDIQTFMAKRAHDYTYIGSEGTTHSFQLSDTRQEAVKDQAVQQVLDTLNKRLNGSGVKDMTIVKKSGGRINVQLPGMTDIQAAVDAIGTTAVLEFRMVDEEFDDAYLEQILAAAKKAMPPEQFQDDKLLDEWLWENKKIDEDRIVLWEYRPEKEGGKPVRAKAYALKSEIVLTGNDVNDAGVGWDQNQQAYVSLEFKPRGGQIFCDITGENVGKRFAIILDNQIQSAPNIKERICGGGARIEMGGAEDPTREAQTLALVLRTGALDAPVVIASKSQVGATLGADAIREGTLAAVWGSVLVYAFMLIWYKTAGFIADIALTCNVLMVLASLGLFQATLTLPGIAGIALTVGMAVDSNIIIYERIREELKLGVHPRKAVDIGFEKALSAVVDANITTAIAGIVMYSYGSGPIKGFAVTLLVGIITTLVTAVFVTRTIMEVLTRSSSTRLQI